MTNAVAAALGISADILGVHLRRANTIHHRITAPSGALAAVVVNASVAGQLASDWGRMATDRTPPTRPNAAQTATGQATVFRDGSRPVAVSTVNGTTCRLSAVCTHLGGIMHWNDSELTWDRPLHGSRFSREGKLFEGPATKDLPRLGPA